MTPDQIREVVKMTLDELMTRKLIKDDYPYKLEVVERHLRSFFNDETCKAVTLSKVLRQLSDDQYIDIIFLQYRDGKTIEWIAEYMEKDESTIKRNKKRLICAIYEMLEL